MLHQQGTLQGSENEAGSFCGLGREGELTALDTSRQDASEPGLVLLEEGIDARAQLGW